MVCRIFSKLPSFCNNWLLWLWSVTSKWREVELFSSRNPHVRHFLCQKCVKRYQKVEKYSIFLIYFRCQASPSRTEGRVLANCAISFSSNDWLCEFVARLPCPVLCCTHITFKRLLRRIVSSCWISYGSVCPWKLRKQLRQALH